MTDNQKKITPLSIVEVVKEETFPARYSWWSMFLSKSMGFFFGIKVSYCHETKTVTIKKKVLGRVFKSVWNNNWFFRADSGNYRVNYSSYEEMKSKVKLIYQYKHKKQ